MAFSLNLPIVEQRKQASEERKLAEASRVSFSRGLIVGFLCAFPLFDFALTGGATVRALMRAAAALLGLR